MGIIQKDGFDFIDDLKEVPSTFIIKGHDLDEEINYIKNNQIKSIYLTEFKSKAIINLDFLKELKFINEVNLNGVDFDYDGLYHLENIKKLTLSIKNKNQYLDFSKFLELEELSIDWYKEFPNLSDNRKLRKLAIWKFRPQTSSLSALSLPEFLEELHLTESNILNLKGVELLNLKEFQAHHCKELQSLDGLFSFSPKIKILILDYCRKLTNYNELRYCINLQKIVLGDCGDIPSLKWLESLKEINHLSFWGTNLVDGNTSYCKGINYVNFKNKRNYSNKVEEFR